MTTSDQATVLGFGGMGRALTEALLAAGHPATVWNRSAARVAEFTGRAAAARSVEDAVTASPLVIVCLLDHASVHEVLDPIAPQLTGRAVLNLTTTTPNQARELAAWAADHGISYLDGGIMAVPEMIGQPGSAILYSGSETVFDRYREVWALWGDAAWFGPDAGMASLYDLAMLSGMYVMFAGFLHGAAMVGSEGVSATDFAARATPFLAAMTGAFREFARIVDARDYAGEGQQSLEFSDLTDLLTASSEQGVRTDVVAPVQALIARQLSAGYGQEGFARIFEELRSA